MTVDAKPDRSVTLLDKHRLIVAMASDPILNHSALKVGIRLVNHFNTRTRRCDPSVRRLAKSTNLSERSVRHALRALESHSWITTRRNAGGAACNAYEPNFARLDEGAALPPPVQSAASEDTGMRPETRNVASPKPLKNKSNESENPSSRAARPNGKTTLSRQRAEQDLVRQFPSDQEGYEFLQNFAGDEYERALEDMQTNGTPAFRVKKFLNDGLYRKFYPK